jgi:flagellar hook-associated protein 1 FlgK
VVEAERVDTLFAGTANSVATSMDSLFQRMQTATDNPTSVAARQLVISDADRLLGTFSTLNGLVLDQGTTINEQLEIFTSETNSLVQNIAQLNKSIVGMGVANANSNPNALMSERDESLRKLAELVEINTIDGSNGEKLVFLGSGQSLVLKEGDFNLLTLNGDPDPNRKDLQLSLSSNSSLTVPMEAEKIGSKIGGLLSFRQEVLEPAQNRLGQIALSLADAFNQQNNLGMDLDGEIGGDLFTLPVSGGFPYNSNTGTADINVALEPGQGTQMTANNVLIEFVGGNLEITAVDDNSEKTGNTTTIAYGGGVTTIDSTTNPGDELFGMTIDITAGMIAGDRFLLKPTANASSSVALATNRPEDIALASPVRTEALISNLGSGEISAGTVFDTDPATSDFTAASALNDDPIYVVYLGGDQFDIYDNDPAGGGALIGTTAVLPTGQYSNIMNSAGAPTDAYGYDFNITGTPVVGDQFTLTYNTGGFHDNRNGLDLANLQNQELIRKNVVSTAMADNTLTFHEAYASVVSQVGEKTSNAMTNETAFDALLEQSRGWHESISGVNLDEEAANLVQFQQAYSAAAKIISVAQATFETLLGAVR